MTAPAAMPSEAEIADLLCGYVPTLDASTEAARAILALFAPILAEKEREIATFDSREAEWNEAIANSLQNEEDAHRKLEDAEAALAAERERCAGIADMAAEREDARAFENDGDLHVAECRGAERAAKTIAAVIRAQGE